MTFCRTVEAQPMHILSYNIRFDNSGDAPQTWRNRLPLIIDQIETFNADIFGCQEALFNQVRDLELAFTAYHRVGVGRDDGLNAGEFSPIFINTKRFKILDEGFFWLSESPDKVSVGWDAAMERIATWVLIRDLSSEDSCLVLNTHFDHVGKVARLESIKLINSFISNVRFANIEKIVMGDLNTAPDQEPYQWFIKESLLVDTYEAAKVRRGPVGTFNAFNYEHISPRIDYVFVSPGFKVISYNVIQSMISGIIPSDHWPVMTIVEKEKIQKD